MMICHVRVRFLVFAAVLLAAQGVAAQSDQTSSGKQKSQRFVLDRVAAVINNAVILESELHVRLLPLSGDLQKISDERERNRRRKKLLSQILEDMISEELIVQAARDAKLKVEPKEINAAIDEIKKQNNLDDSGLKQALAMQGFTLATYKRDVKRQIMRMRSINMLVRPRVTITDEDVRARYDEMSRRSAAVSKVHLKHVLIELAQRSEEQVARAKSRAAEVIEQAKNGKAFAELAKQYSDDRATVTSGGDLGWIERGSLPTEWEVIVFSMDKGEVRGPISGPNGLHVFYVEDLKKSDLKPFDELKEQLRNELYRKEMDKQTLLWLEELRKKAHIERNLQ